VPFSFFRYNVYVTTTFYRSSKEDTKLYVTFASTVGGALLLLIIFIIILFMVRLCVLRLVHVSENYYGIVHSCCCAVGQ
jgi:hypothetical protein